MKKLVSLLFIFFILLYLFTFDTGDFDSHIIYSDDYVIITKLDLNTKDLVNLNGGLVYNTLDTDRLGDINYYNREDVMLVDLDLGHIDYAICRGNNLRKDSRGYNIYEY